MRQPTVAKLHHANWFAVRAAVPRADLPWLIPAIKARGGADLLVSKIDQIVP
jgi:ATP phosphoribosyltransferase